jgi:hypothetical protein
LTVGGVQLRRKIIELLRYGTRSCSGALLIDQAPDVAIVGELEEETRARLANHPVVREPPFGLPFNH